MLSGRGVPNFAGLRFFKSFLASSNPPLNASLASKLRYQPPPPIAPNTIVFKNRLPHPPEEAVISHRKTADEAIKMEK